MSLKSVRVAALLIDGEDFVLVKDEKCFPYIDLPTKNKAKNYLTRYLLDAYKIRAQFSFIGFECFIEVDNYVYLVYAIQTKVEEHVELIRYNRSALPTNLADWTEEATIALENDGTFTWED